MNRLFGRIYLPLALVVVVTVVSSAYFAFRVLPARAEEYSRRRLEDFRERIQALEVQSPDRILALADSMGVEGSRILPTNPADPAFRPPLPRPGTIFLPGIGMEAGFVVEVPILPPGHRLFGRGTIWIFIGALLTAEAIVLLLSLAPLRRRLGQFEAATDRLGSGDLAARVPVRDPGDILDTLGETFNSMAARISALVGSHQELLGSVAHELRTPLARIRFALELLRESGGAAPDARISSMEKDLTALDSLLAELLAYNRLVRTDSIEPERVELAALVSEAASAESWSRQDVAFTITGTAEAAADRKLLGRAVANVLRNAFRYASSRVSATVGASGGQPWIEICDDGPGFGAEVAERLGKPFSKGPESQGTGLGLATVERIASLHSATVEYGRAEAGGARVRIWLRVES